MLLSSHILAEVEALADRVSIIRRGRTVTTGSLADLRRHTADLGPRGDGGRARGLRAADGVEDVAEAPIDGMHEVRFTVEARQLDSAIGLLHAAGIHSLTARPPSLDALFLRNYGEALDEAERDEELEGVGR